MPPDHGQKRQQPHVLYAQKMGKNVLKSDGTVQCAHKHKRIPFMDNAGKHLVLSFGGMTTPVPHEKHGLVGTTCLWQSCKKRVGNS